MHSRVMVVLLFVIACCLLCAPWWIRLDLLNWLCFADFVLLRDLISFVCFGFVGRLLWV